MRQYLGIQPAPYLIDSHMPPVRVSGLYRLEYVTCESCMAFISKRPKRNEACKHHQMSEMYGLLSLYMIGL